MAALERVAGADAQDCVGDARKVLFVVDPGQLRRSRGHASARNAARGGRGDRSRAPGGGRVRLPLPERLRRLEEILGRKVKLVPFSPDPVRFLKSAFAPVEVRSVVVTERDGRRRAYVEVDKLHRGLAIGKDGHNIALVRRLAMRHHDIHEVVVGARLKDRI